MDHLVCKDPNTSAERPETLKPVNVHAQSRAEDYSETLAFVRLLNALLRASAGGAPLPDGAAAAFAQFAGHVREDVLGQLNQRGYKCV